MELLESVSQKSGETATGQDKQVTLFWFLVLDLFGCMQCGLMLQKLTEDMRAHALLFC